MALFSDGSISTVEDLTAHDSAVLDVASVESIDVTKKLKLAEERLGMELTNFLPAGDSLDRVVVTPAIRLWHAFHALELMYRDAYGNQLNERYAGKRDQYGALAKWATEKLLDSGIGMASSPVGKAEPAELSYCAGNQASASYYVTAAWVNTRGQEGAAAEWKAITVPDQNILNVRAAAAPSGAAGWNVYVGFSPETMSRQNDPLLGVTEAWLQSRAVTTSGEVPGTGQSADYTRAVTRTLQRG
jgi:hypothetical protein